MARISRASTCSKFQRFEGLRVNLATTPLAVLGDNVVVVQQYEIGGTLRRLLAVLRMRLSFLIEQCVS